MDNFQEGEVLTPLPEKNKDAVTMDFPDAIREIISGKKVTRISWGNDDYGFLKDEWLTIYTGGKFHTWLVSQGDLEGNDWTVKYEN